MKIETGKKNVMHWYTVVCFLFLFVRKAKQKTENEEKTGNKEAEGLFSHFPGCLLDGYFQDNLIGTLFGDSEIHSSVVWVCLSTL